MGLWAGIEWQEEGPRRWVRPAGCGLGVAKAGPEVGV